MAINQQNANPPSVNITSFSDTMEQAAGAIGELSLGSLYSQTAGRTDAGAFLRERATILRGLVNEIDRPILKGLATEMLSTMAGWFEDPEVLCCLINAIWVSFESTQDIQPGLDYELNIADTEFGDFLDKIIAFIDLIIAFLTQDLKKIVAFIPDFIKELFGALMGAILLLLQETLYVIRDSALQSILDWIDESTEGDQLWSGCLPMQQFLGIIKKYVSDYGLFGELMEKIRGYVSGQKSAWLNKTMNLVPNARDLEFLYWLRDLLIKLKQAVINFELCIEYAYIPDNNYSNDNSDQLATDNSTLVTDPDNIANQDIPASQKVPLIIGDDGKTVLISNKDTRIKEDELQIDPSTGQPINGTYISRLSNDSIVNFIKNNYGFSSDVVEQSLKKVSDGCPGFPGGSDLKSYLDKVKNRNIR